MPITSGAPSVPVATTWSSQIFSTIVFGNGVLIGSCDASRRVKRRHRPCDPSVQFDTSPIVRAMSEPRPVRPARALSRAARRPRSRGRARHAQGHRLHRRGSLEADRRRRHDLDRDDAVQLQPARAGGEGQGRHPGRRGDADGVQHDLGLRWGLDGDRGNEGLARVARGDRGLDRARGARTPVRRSRVPGRLRQDAAGRGDGAGPPRPARPGPVQRHDQSRRAARATGRDGRDRVRGDRRVSGREDQPRGAAGDRGRVLPRSRAPAAANSPRTR